MKVIALYFVFAFQLSVQAQSTAGLTGKLDTSYNILSEYAKLKKTYPQIEIVNELHSPLVKEDKNITYCKVGDRKLLLDVFYPSKKENKKRVAVMFIHGGGWRSGNRTQHYPLAERLALMGYVCITPEYRLSTEALYPAAVNDLKAALQWIHANAKKFNIDTSRIVVAGFSAGGQLATLLGATSGTSLFQNLECNSKYSSAVHAIIDMDGILAFIHSESGEGDDSKRTSAATNWFGYSKTEKPDLWKQASALTYAGARTPPTLFINSGVARMHAGRNDFIKVLKENNIYTEVKTFEDAPHSFPLFDPWFTPSLKYIDEFLKKTFR